MIYTHTLNAVGPASAVRPVAWPSRLMAAHPEVLY
jgi:hypothetical protein